MASNKNKTEGDVSEHKIKLGFVEEVDHRLISSKFFPSKVGGKPAWLSLDPVPEFEAVKCDSCGGPTVFLIQVYAPLKTEESFHRSVFIFVCSQESCVKENDNHNFKVLRSQLPLKNKFYSEDPPDENIDSDEDCSSSLPHAKHFQNLCNVCGVKSSKKCAKCKNVYYCSREHQTLDWKCKHKRMCDEISKQTEEELNNQGDEHGHELLHNEYELVTEEEQDENSESKKGKTEEQRLEEYQVMMDALKMKRSDGTRQYTEEDLDQAATGETDDDRHFLYFKKRIESEPTQVLRYARGGEPLWVSSFHKPSTEIIPNCSCGAKRIFEFQVMPQLLNYLKVDSLDWGTLCVYTCAESCSIGNAYHEEFIWKQDFHAVKDGSKNE